MIAKNRRDVLRVLAAAAAGLSLCPCSRAVAQGFPTGADSPDEWTNSGGGDPSQLGSIGLSHHIGCQLSAAESGALDPGRFGFSTGDLSMDQKFGIEGNVLMQAFQAAPTLAVFNDLDGPNAFATSQDIFGRSPYGSVVFGLTLLRQEVAQFGETAIIGILAHEWGHIAQFQRGGLGSGKRPELHADFLAGWYLGAKFFQSGNVFINVRELAGSLFDKGDSNFNSPNHHGLPQERIAAMVAGTDTGLRGVLQIDRAFSLGRQFVA